MQGSTPEQTDVLVIGGGPAGCTAAALLARRGFSVRLLERDRFPRFQIGESLLPFNNEIFDRLGITEELQQGQFVPKYGAHFVTGDGAVEYTFRFDRHLEPEHHRSFQVKRADFDYLLLRTARGAGVDVREQAAVTAVDLSHRDRVIVQTAKGEQFGARFVMDATGHSSLIGSREGNRSEEKSLKKVAFFAHYRGVARPLGRDAGNTTIVIIRNGWFWLIPVSEELMSVGLVVDRDQYAGGRITPQTLMERTIAATPFVRKRMQGSERITQVFARKDFSYRMRRVVGPNFALIGDAAGFLDPIFSTGVFMAMKSADLAAQGVEARLRSGSMKPLLSYQRSVTTAMSRYFRFIRNFYRRDFLEVFLQPSRRFGLLPAIVRVLAGDVFAARGNRWKIAAFFLLVSIQRRKPIIARRIRWERLPDAASV